jgi:KipI family sensor histidine kinase inhibitor
VAAHVAARDVVPAARSVLFAGCADAGLLAVELAGLGVERTVAAPAPRVEVPTTYDGPDLPDVARRWGMSVAEVVATHTSVDYVVAFCGFAPGFAYCTGLPDALAVPRHRDPRPRVPVGSVGLAGEFTGVYPTASPGGWRLLGRTDLVLWDAARDEPALLAPGTRVRFVEA